MDPTSIILLYKRYRLDWGLTEPQALTVLDDDGVGTSEEIRAELEHDCLLDKWPVGWSEEEWTKLARWYSYREVMYWLSRVVETTSTNLYLAPLLACQSRLAPQLRTVCDAYHVICESPKISVGKTRAAKALTYMADGKFYESATIAALKGVRIKGPTTIGIDEADEAQRSDPELRPYLLTSYAWDANYVKYSDDPKRVLVSLPYGGPVILTFRTKPWSSIESRSHRMVMEQASSYNVADDGDGQGYRKLLGPSRIWLQSKCEAALAEKDAMWAARRTHEPDFVARLNRISAKAMILRQRGFAKSILLIAELMELDMDEVEKELTQIIDVQEFESENAVIIDAIRADLDFAESLATHAEVPVEELRFRVQKYLHDRAESLWLSRNRFAAALEEMGFSKKAGSWRRSRVRGQDTMVLDPAMWEAEQKKVP